MTAFGWLLILAVLTSWPASVLLGRVMARTSQAAGDFDRAVDEALRVVGEVRR